MPRLIRAKWRPTLALIVACTVLGVLALPTVGLFALMDLAPVMGWTTARNGIALVILLGTGLIGYVLWRTIMRPVTALSDFAQDPDATLPGHFGTRELAHLAGDVARMRGRLEDREAGMRAFAGHVTHELRSPLSAILGAAELLETVEDPETRSELIGNIDAATRRAQRLLDDLHRLTRAHDPRGEGPCSLRAVARAIDAPFVPSGEDRVPLPAETLTAVLDQLAQNAVRHGAGRIALHHGEGRLTVTDDGSGITDADRARVFDPFFTTARDLGGTGMGLPIARALLQASGADIVVADVETGARFDIVMPEEAGV